jgi:hypothetical protein
MTKGFWFQSIELEEEEGSGFGIFEKIWLSDVGEETEWRRKGLWVRIKRTYDEGFWYMNFCFKNIFEL